MLARAAGSGQLEEVYEFFNAEYALDLRIFKFPKPVIVIADGVTMGGGLGLCAGADAVIRTERTRMAMPRIPYRPLCRCGRHGLAFQKMPARLPRISGAYRL